MDKEDVVYIPWDTSQPLKKNEILPFAATWLDLKDIMLSEISQTEKDKCSMILLHVESKKYDKLVTVT